MSKSDVCRLKRAWRTDADAFGIVGPLREEAEGWLVHPALADSMLHLTVCALAQLLCTFSPCLGILLFAQTVAPPPPEGGWPWDKNEDTQIEAK